MAVEFEKYKDIAYVISKVKIYTWYKRFLTIKKLLRSKSLDRKFFADNTIRI